jgi:hypothetical protein
MPTHRRIHHHEHIGWPTPVTGLIASALFAAVLAYILLLMLARA